MTVTPKTKSDGRSTDFIEEVCEAAGLPHRVPLFDDAQTHDELIGRMGDALLIVCWDIMRTLPRKHRGRLIWRVIRLFNAESYRRHHLCMFRLLGESLMAVNEGLRPLLIAELGSSDQVEQLLGASYGSCMAIFANLLRLSDEEKEWLVQVISRVMDEHRNHPPTNDQERYQRFIDASEYPPTPVHIVRLIQQLINCHFRLEARQFAARWKALT